MVKNCDISCSASNDRYLAGRRQTQFYDIRQCYVDKLARAFDERDWSSVTGAAEIDDAYNTMSGNCPSVDTTDYTMSKGHFNKIHENLTAYYSAC